MINERFQYLFKRYKAGQLSERDELDWQDMLMDDNFKAIIESDIEAFMTGYLTRDLAKKELLEIIWQSITAAIYKKYKCP